MEPWTPLKSAKTPDGRDLVLYRRGVEFMLRVGGRELMSSRASASEEAMAAIACRPLRGRRGACVLVGGLGLGYTLRAALDSLSTSAAVLVAELIPAVVEWNRGLLGSLTGWPLRDERVTVAGTDVGAIIREGVSRFDAILLDVDNGPGALCCGGNGDLYTFSGLSAVKAALNPEGVLAVWSPSPDRVFENRLSQAGFHVQACSVAACASSPRTRHTLYFGYLPIAPDSPLVTQRGPSVRSVAPEPI